MIEISLTEFPEVGFGYDVHITDENATIADYVAALDEFQAKYVADCRGCDGCCWERVPLGIADYFWGRNLLPEPCSITEWLEKTAKLTEITGGIDLYLKRGADNACMFLDKEKKECENHTARPLVCRTHTCLPKSYRALELRSAIVNMLEDELVRRLLMENQEAGNISFKKEWREILQKAKIEDYPKTPLSDYSIAELEKSCLHVKIKQIVNVESWQELLK